MKSNGLYPRVRTDMAGTAMVSQGGAVGLVETVRVVGLDRALSEALAPWRKPQARHDPGKIVIDLAIALAVGGDCLADIAVLRGQPGVFGAVASDPTVSRLVDTLAGDASKALAAIDTARAQVRARVWSLAGEHAPDHAAGVDDPIVVDLDATLLTSHSDKEQAAPTFKKGFGFHPLLSFLDHGPDGTGEPLSFLLRKGNAGSNTAADHITVARAAFAQLPGHRPGRRPGKSVLVRTDGAGATHAFLDWLTGQRVQYSVGFQLPTDFADQVRILDQAGVWCPALDADEQIRPDAMVADATGLLDLASWPPGMRVIVRKEKPHPGAQLRITDVNALAGHRLRHQHPRHRRTPTVLRTPGTAPPPPGALRGPHPHRQGHRSDQPAAARLRPEPHLARDRRPCLRAHRLVAAARPHRPPRPSVGTQTPTTTTVLHHRTPGRPRPHPPTAPVSRGALGMAAPGRPGPPPRTARPDLTPDPPAPTTPAPPTGTWTRRPPARKRATCHTPDAESALRRRLHRRLGQCRGTHETSGLVLRTVAEVSEQVAHRDATATAADVFRAGVELRAGHSGRQARLLLCNVMASVGAVFLGAAIAQGLWADSVHPEC